MSTYVGRHRASHTPSAPALLAGARANAARSGLVLAATGGLVAAFAAPAQSAPSSPSTVASLAPAVTAPAAAAPLAHSFGVLGVKAVAKPKPKPVMVATLVRAETAASRSTTRPATTTTHTTSSGGTTTSNPSTPSTPSTPAHGGVLGIAASLLGIPYVYGGATPAGFDCSGFTMYVFGQVGISLPRTAAGQQAAATPVSNPQPGDLVFFGYPAYHVGIYAGGGMMYDSPHTGAVTSLRAVFGGVSGYGRP
ncbi:MAG: C40 family peptidase [Dermatophilaceae bacterium]